ncbi:MAG: hypothetical protein ACRDHZ_02455 [Ktedonobacteraceae bacterium]
MVVDVVLYLAVHQPRRLKLPAQPIPRCASIEDITHCLFDERLNKRSFRQMAHSCYYPAVRLFLDVVRQQGLRLALGISLSFVQQATLWEPALLDLLRELAAEEAVELVGMDPYRSLHCLLDLPAYGVRMQWMAGEMEHIFGKRPIVSDAFGLGMSSSLYQALDAAGFCGVLLESGSRVMQWRSSNYVYCAGDDTTCVASSQPPALTRRKTAHLSARDLLGPPYTVDEPCEHAPYLLVRHDALSADLSTRFAGHAQAGVPLYADTYADWLTRVEGDCVLLDCDLTHFAEHQRSGFGEFMQALPQECLKRGITTRTPSELMERVSAARRAYHLPLPKHSAVLASFTNPDLYCEHEEQRIILQSMRDVYQLAQLTEHPALLDIALWLAQADNLHLVRWPGPQLVTTITPHKWWYLGPTRLLHEQRQVYNNALYALEAYLPTRLLRQSKLQGPAKSARPESLPVP